MKKNSHRRGMRIWAIIGLMVANVWAADPVPGVEELFLATFKDVRPVELGAVPSGISMAVTSSSDVAQKHVVQGLNLIHGGWDFEAYRHFTAALKLDPECLMAHFGLVFCLLDSEADYQKPRNAAAERAVVLVEEGVGTDLERGYIFAMAKLLEAGPDAAAEAFGLVALKYPQDLQLKLFETYFRRSGFDDLGSPKPGQKVAQEILQGMLKKQPDTPFLMHAWLMIRAENLKMHEDLPMARKLCQLVPDYAPYQHLLGHYEWRCGNHREAALAFSRSGDLYLAWMKNSVVSIADCPEWIRAEIYRAVALASSGDYESALAAAQALVKVPIPAARMKSPGARMMWWEANTLEARLLMRRGMPGDMAKAKASLPSKEAVNAMAPLSKIAFFYQGLALLLEGQVALEEKNDKRVEEMQQAMAMHLPLMDQMRRDAGNFGELSYFIRAYTFLDIGNYALKGDFAMSKTDGSFQVAYNYYSSARERQLLPTRAMPPIYLQPMHLFLGRFYLKKNNPQDAMAMYQEGLEFWPRDLSLLLARKELQIATKDEAGAAATDVLIREVSEEK